MSFDCRLHAWKTGFKARLPVPSTGRCFTSFFTGVR